jgi:HNH endonuclease
MTIPTKPRKFVRTPWTPEEEAYMRQHYAETPTQAIADHLGRSLRKVYSKAYCMDLNKSLAFLASEASGRMKQPLHGGKAHWFKPGNTSHNKGMKGFYAPGSEKGWFGKGHHPANYCEVGTLRINADGYIDIKLADGFHQWFLLARYNWFLHTGHWTTSKECIWYKNGDKHDCAPENLEVITRREHMQRTTLHRLPKEMALTIQLRGALTRAINKHSKAQPMQTQGATA